jgi:triosephosphate isomerase
MSQRRKLAIANWKMYKTGVQAVDYVNQVAKPVEGKEVGVYLAVPFTALALAAEAAERTPVIIGAQNMHAAKEGAFTGEIAAPMLSSAGARFVLLGHSERRRAFGETSSDIHLKVVAALAEGLEVVLCVGEDFEKELAAELQGIEACDKLIIAYEPEWAIGTGRVALNKEIEKAHQLIREALASLFGKKGANRIPVVYGGSVTAENSKKLAKVEGVDGFLVGRASLDPKDFLTIVESL